MGKICSSCGKQVRESMRFCNSCGAPVTTKQESRPASISCAGCGNTLAATVSFCTKCGTSVGTRTAVGVGRDVREPDSGSYGADDAVSKEYEPQAYGQSDYDQRVNTSTPEFNALSPGAKCAAICGLIALIGCFLPLASALGESFSLIAGVREVPHILIVPLCAVGVMVMAWTPRQASSRVRGKLGGAVIAVGSPWAVFWFLMLVLGQRVSGAIGGFGGAGIGPGTLLLMLGFAGSVVGGFMILGEALES